MKKWFSSAMFDFRWKKMNGYQRTMLVMSFLLMVLSMVILAVSQLACSECITMKTAGLLISFMVFVWSVPFIGETMQAEGRINQKYLNEMNEIRKSLGRKEWEDI